MRKNPTAIISLCAFILHSKVGQSFVQNVQLKRQLPSPANSKLGSNLYAAPPTLEKWVYLSNGSVQGIVKNHPTFDDGDEITTSTIMPTMDLVAFKVVKTRNGSQYKLGRPAQGQKEVIRSKQQSSSSSGNKGSSAGNSISITGGGNLFGSFFGNANGKSSSPAPTPAPAVVAPAPSPAAIRQAESYRLNLNGRTVGNGKYLLAGKAVTSSLKSLIFAAYRSDSKGQPIGQQLTVKLSTNYEALERENRNYNRAANGIFPGAFVNKIEFLAYADGKGFDDYSALVIEAGRTDLRALLNERGDVGLEGRALRDAAAAAGLCIQAMHSSGLVWTDLKAENFVIVTESDGETNLPGVKGIDLESAMPARSNPVDYSPEACPPEFAKVFMMGDAGEFVLDPSYDIWSLGMLLYELSTGSGYFAGQKPAVITKLLADDSFVADVSLIEDLKLRDLVSKCLQNDPKKRPNITTFLLHPYFTTTGLFAWSF